MGDTARQKLCLGAIAFITETPISTDDSLAMLGAAITRDAAAKIKGSQSLLFALLPFFLENGLKQIRAGMHPATLKKNMQKDVALTLQHLSKAPVSPEELLSIAIETCHDASIARLVIEASQKPIVLLENGQSSDTSLTIHSGLELDSGFLSPHFCTDGPICKMHNVHLVSIDKEISSIQEFNLHSTKEPLLLIAQDITHDALSTLIINHLHGMRNICAIKKGKTALPYTFAQKVVVSKDKTTLFIPELQTRTIALLHIGGKTHAEIEEKRRLFETTLTAVQEALQGGLAHLPVSSGTQGPYASLFATPKPHLLIEQSLSLALMISETLLLSEVLLCPH